MKTVFNKIAELGLIPVIKLEDSSKAVDLAEALLNGGLPAMEITFRSSAAEESIKAVKSKYPDMLVGAGTVLTVETVKTAVDAGAEFIVAPGFNPRIVDYCLSNDIPVIPGINSPAQIEQALERDLSCVKFFPAENSGGVKMLKALAAPYADISFMPTGGINPENVGDYMKFDRVTACGGSWMLKPSLIEEGNFTEITKKSREAVAAVLGFRLKNITFYHEEGADIEWNKNLMENILGFGLSGSHKDTAPLLTAESSRQKEAKGLITLKTNRAEVARAYLQRNGLNIEEDSQIMDKGILTGFQLKEQISAFNIEITSI